MFKKINHINIGTIYTEKSKPFKLDVNSKDHELVIVSNDYKRQIYSRSIVFAIIYFVLLVSYVAVKPLKFASENYIFKKVYDNVNLDLYRPEVLWQWNGPDIFLLFIIVPALSFLYHIISIISYKCPSIVTKSFYENNILYGVNTVYWVEYSISLSTILYCSSIMSGLLDFTVLLAIIVLNFGIIIFGWDLSESLNGGLTSIHISEGNINKPNDKNVYYKKVNWINFIFFGILYSLTIIIILFSFISFNQNEKTNLYFKYIICSVITLQYIVYHILILFRFIDVQIQNDVPEPQPETKTRNVMPADLKNQNLSIIEANGRYELSKIMIGNIAKIVIIIIFFVRSIVVF